MSADLLAPPEGAARTLHVIVLHSQPAQRALLEGALAELLPGSKASQAEDCRAAMRVMTASKADLIVAEHAGRPGDGLELLQTLRRNPVLARKPVVLLAAPGAPLADPSDAFLRVLEPAAAPSALALALRSFDSLAVAGPAAPPLSAPAGRPLLLVLSNQNACRGAMLQAVLRRALGGAYRVEGCGHRPGSVDGLTVEVMKELGLDLSTHQPRGLRDHDLTGLAVTVNLCFGEPGPIVPGRGHQRFDWPTPDPLRGLADPAAILGRLRQTRDLLTQRADKLLVSLAAA